MLGGASGLAADAVIGKDQPMRLEEWEGAIDKIVDACRQEPNEQTMIKLLMAWRLELEKGPSRLEPFQIDEIIREVRDRLGRGEKRL
jgi:hypothetical protein